MSAIIYALTNPIFKNFVFYAAASTVKMMAMSLLTSRKRFAKNVFSNPEDIPLGNKNQAKVTFTDPDVERVRRNHLNDIENILPFVVIGMFYVATNPNAMLALWHFRIFFFSRIFHTIAYQLPLPQPSRAIGYTIGYLTTISMAVQLFRALLK
ncbi:unnamed protein product [Rotaria socialis]|uniref:Microsomal glutathione S-transferase 1 n=1 Tax=Rotaria socialis TaxID=392032 RepID=A0A820UY41_9BILA|nr:unnamed protein product [Rotaria socialis]CAF3349502.1 unnamed protein product [Rotaria socialis]CAF3394601.1 unnamed protein product [Rotaria socialis]CAF3576334.1 unnamed protein product [Rotaria socialis]CAF3604260.1 unnamed protein product [Rotaria socialis]